MTTRSPSCCRLRFVCSSTRAAPRSPQLGSTTKPVSRGRPSTGTGRSRHSSRVADAAEAFINGILEPIHTVIDQALESGDLTGDARDLVADVAGPLIFQHVIMGRDIPRDRARGVVDVFVDTHTR